MLPINVNVLNGEANGTRALVRKVVLREGVEPQVVMLNGVIPIHAVLAGDVAYINLEHTSKRAPKPHFKTRSSQVIFQGENTKTTSPTSIL